MALVPIAAPQNNNLELIRALTDAAQRGVQNYQGYQDRQLAKQQQLEQRQRAEAAATTQADFYGGRLGAGQMGPPTQGLLSDTGLSRDQIETMILGGQGDMLHSLAQQRLTPKPPEAPKTRSYRQGNQEVTEQFNATTGQWDRVSVGDAFRPADKTEINLPANRPPLQAGEQYVLDANGEVIGIRELPGGAVEKARLAGEQQAVAEAQAKGEQAALIDREVGRVLEFIEDPDTWGGIVAQGMSAVPGSAAHTAQGALNTIKSNLTIENLRAAKASGTTFGALSDTEIGIIAALAGSLEIGGDPEILIENLMDIQRRIGRATQAAPSAPTAPQGTGAFRSFDDLLRQYGG